MELFHKGFHKFKMVDAPVVSAVFSYDIALLKGVDESAMAYL